MKKWLIAAAVCLALMVGYRLLFSAPEVRNARPEGTNIICFGDSLTSGTGAPDGQDYPAMLSRLIGRPVVNAGVPGNTTGDAIARLEKDVLARSPRIVLLTLGGNDLKNRIDKTVAFANLKQIVEAVQDHGALVVIGGLRFPLYDRGYSQAYETLAEETGSVLIPNIYDGIMGNRELMSDPIHPNGDGYALMAEKFHEAIRPYL